MAVPLFHAELLSNIKSITTSINLPSPSNLSTKLTSSTPSQLQLYHNGETTTFNLPANITLTAAALLEKSRIIAGETKLSYRLPVSPESCSALPTSAASENHVPWSAVSLSSSTKDVSICCKSCSSELVPGEKINMWKDLPSGNWADMMDFWHCHKPETGSKQTGAGDRYAGLEGGYMTMEGTALVELTYFLVAQGDCGSAVEIVEATTLKEEYTQLCCSSCRTILGVVDTDRETVRGWRLNKWNLKLQLSANGMCEEYSYPIAPFLSAQLLAFAEREGIRRLIVSCDDNDEDTNWLKLWLFNTDIKYTSSGTRRPMRAVKVFYQEVKAKGSFGTEQGTSLACGGFEEVRLMREMVEGLREELKKSTDGLLEELTQFREWKVGALQRFESERI